VHRDIKPANVMLNRRGGVPDFVKLLDFGLVRAVDDAKRTKHQEGMAGTPLYMSPESIQTPDLVDARSDLYAVGAVGYFLLTGAPIFQASSLAELCQLHVDAVPLAPSVRAGKSITSELEHAIMSCLEKNRSKRPQTARDLSNLLHRLAASDAWTIYDADAWWSRYERGSNPSIDPLPAEGPSTGGSQASSPMKSQAKSHASSQANSQARFPSQSQPQPNPSHSETQLLTQLPSAPPAENEQTWRTMVESKDFDKTVDFGTISGDGPDSIETKTT